jgi:DNA-binding MarR family transcriptional regulator
MSYREYANEIVIPALLRAARGSYAQAVRVSLAAAGFDDMPRNGPYVLGGMSNHGVALEDLIRNLRVSKQSASQLIDSLVVRGYLEREVNPEDRRRLIIQLTDRGRAAAAAVEEGVREVDEKLAEMLSAEEITTLRVGLAALADIGDRLETAG